jgi:carbamoyltransferase
MILLGTGGSDHDFSAAILADGNLVAAIEDERVIRIKHGRQAWYRAPVEPSVSYCLERAELDIDSIDLVYSNLHVEKSARFLSQMPVNYIGHHLSHAACTFLASPLEYATVAVIDGAGHRLSGNVDRVELETISIGRGESNLVSVSTLQSGTRNLATGFWRYMCSNSIGALYEAVTEVIGFGSYGTGKTMGLAAYGDDTLVAEMRQFVTIAPEGAFAFDPYGGLLDWAQELIRCGRNPFMVRANLAAAVQAIFEDAVMGVLNHAYRTHPNAALCYSGGCALNTIANSLIPTRTPFEHVFIHPATNDGGTAIGAALYGWYSDLGNRRAPADCESIGAIAFSPIQYTEHELRTALEDSPTFFYKPANLYEVVATRLLDNQVGAWFQAGAEIGPRALGNRSIVANPRQAKMRDHINLKVKRRETFRPLAPVVTEEAATKYFELSSKSPFMLTIAHVKPDYRSRLGAVTHVDGTARVQTVSERENDRFYTLLREVGRQSGMPILLNTSFNLPNEPIVETPHQAVQAFLSMDLDFLVLGDYVAEKHTPWADRTVAI